MMADGGCAQTDEGPETPSNIRIPLQVLINVQHLEQEVRAGQHATATVPDSVDQQEMAQVEALLDEQVEHVYRLLTRYKANLEGIQSAASHEQNVQTGQEAQTAATDHVQVSTLEPIGADKNRSPFSRQTDVDLAHSEPGNSPSRSRTCSVQQEGRVHLSPPKVHIPPESHLSDRRLRSISPHRRRVVKRRSSSGSSTRSDTSFASSTVSDDSHNDPTDYYARFHGHAQSNTSTLPFTSPRVSSRPLNPIEGESSRTVSSPSPPPRDAWGAQRPPQERHERSNNREDHGSQPRLHRGGHARNRRLGPDNHLDYGSARRPQSPSPPRQQNRYRLDRRARSPSSVRQAGRRSIGEDMKLIREYPDFIWDETERRWRHKKSVGFLTHPSSPHLSARMVANRASDFVPGDQSLSIILHCDFFSF